MNFNRKLLAGAICAAFGVVVLAPSAWAQQTSVPAKGKSETSGQSKKQDNRNTTNLKAVVVTGARASLQSAQEIKRQSSEIVDAIVAEDIGKLPDQTMSSALQRITGVQISRDVGEGGSVTIRGLPQVQTTLNGRAIFTAGGGRTFNPEDFPSELIKEIKVYKTSSADMVSGGVGGTIDVTTHKPFDFKGFKAAGSVSEDHADLINKTKPTASGLVSDRWDTSIGQFGALLSASYQERAYREDTNSNGAPQERTNLIPGRTVIAPTGSYEPIITGLRKRTGVNAALQWRPSNDLQFYAEGNFVKLKTRQDQRGIYLYTGGLNPVPGSIQTFPGTNDFMRGSYTGATALTFGTSRDTQDTVQQYALGGKWFHGPWTVDGEASYTNSTSDLVYRELDLKAPGATVTQDMTSAVPSTTVTGVNLTDPNAFAFGALTDSINHFKQNLSAFKLNAEYSINSPITAIKAGIRLGHLTSSFTPIRFYQAASPSVTLADQPSYYGITPYTNFYSRTLPNVSFPRTYLVTNPNELRNNFTAVRQALGIGTAPSVSPLSVFQATEKTYAGYLMAMFDAGSSIPVDGNFGVRVVRTQDALVGNQPLYAGGVQSGYTPIHGNNSYVDVLPSFNMRVHLTENLQLKLAASKTMTRPDFTNLSPSLTLVPANGQAASGNPNLKPVRSDNYDASLAWFFTPSSSIYGAAFYKNINGFIETTVTPGVVINGIVYNLAQPSSGSNGKVRGLEAGYQQFFDFLPGWLSGFGMQANYTYVNSQAPSSVKGVTTTLPQLSRDSYNLVGMYEKGPLSVRVAYNWRSRFFSSLYVGTGSLTANPIYSKGYGWLDASIDYSINKDATVFFSASNLTRTRLDSYFTYTDRPGTSMINDREYMLGVRFNL